MIRYFKDGVESSLHVLLPNVSNPELLTEEELERLGIKILRKPKDIEGYQWSPVEPTWVEGNLEGGWELKEIQREETPDWGGWQIEQLEDPTWIEFASKQPYLQSILSVLISQVTEKPETLYSIIAVWQQIIRLNSPNSQELNSWLERARRYNLPQSFINCFRKPA